MDSSGQAGNIAPTRKPEAPRPYLCQPVYSTRAQPARQLSSHESWKQPNIRLDSSLATKLRRRARTISTLNLAPVDYACRGRPIVDGLDRGDGPVART